MAGIDTSIFKGHSYRSASTSKADGLGVSMDVILKAANWARASTFSKFYKKQTCDDGAFARAVLST